MTQRRQPGLVRRHAKPRRAGGGGRPVPLFGIDVTGRPRVRTTVLGGLDWGGRTRGLGNALTQSLLPFPLSVERWRTLVARYAGGIPVDYLLAWIKRESNGNPCSWTTLRESGLFQLMYPDNLNSAGTTEEKLRAACVPNTQTLLRQLTDAESAEQVRSGVQYVNYVRGRAHQKLDTAGVKWPESSADFWRFVKLQHAYPSPTLGWLQAATQKLGHPPRDWAEFRSTITGYESVLDNAEWVGAYGAGGGGLSTTTLVAVGALAVLGALALHRRRAPSLW